MKKHMFSFPGVFFFFFWSLFSYVYAPGYPIRIVSCLCCCIYHIPSHDSILGFACLSTLLDKMEGGWLRVSFVCHLICHLFCLLCLSHLICLSPLVDSPSREYPLQLMRDFLSSRYHGMAFREHGGGLALVFALFYFIFIFCSWAYTKCHCQLSLAVYLGVVSDRLYIGACTCMRT